MRDFFSLDGPFNKYGSMVADMIILSLMWLFFSVIGLGITTGASTSAMFFVSTRRIANREGYITADFWMAFKANFKRATIVWLIFVFAVWLIWFNVNNISAVGALSVVIFPAQVVLLIELGLMSVYIFPMNARFDMGVKQLFKSSFYMANRHLLTSISCLSLLVAGVLLFLVMPPLALFLAPGVYAWLSSYMIMKIFKKYRPEMDKDPMLEIQEIEAQKELERRNRRFSPAQKDDDGDIEADEVEPLMEDENEVIDAEAEFIDDDGDSNDIWAKLREAGDAEEASPPPVPPVEAPQPEPEKPVIVKEVSRIDSIFGDEDGEDSDTNINDDIWARLRKAGDSDA